MIELRDVQDAARRLEGVAHRTPVLTSRTLDERVGASVFLKAECLQRGGAFKFRGAYNTIGSLSKDERERGVVAFSSGNHAQAVALAARLLGTSATIFMPEDAPAAKVEATAGYGPEIRRYDRFTQEREELALALVAERGATLVPPYDHPLIMAGAGTAALELLDDAGPLDLLLAPVGGGGLIAGCATVTKALSPDTRVVGVEPADADDTRRSLAAGERVRIEPPRGIADGLQVVEPGRLSFEVNRRRVDEVVTVTDPQIVEAMAFLFDRLKLVTEPSGAIGVAALLAGAVEARDRVGVVISGGNVGVDRFAELVSARA